MSRHDFEGVLDEVTIYRRGLTPGEIAAIYDAGADGKCKYQQVVLDLGGGKINCKSNNTITVDVLSVNGFDATTIDHTTVRFGKTGTEATETHTVPRTGEPRRHEVDADGDGDTDLRFHFRFDDTGLVCGDWEVRLTGATFDDPNTIIEGFATIETK